MSRTASSRRLAVRHLAGSVLCPKKTYGWGAQTGSSASLSSGSNPWSVACWYQADERPYQSWMLALFENYNGVGAGWCINDYGLGILYTYVSSYGPLMAQPSTYKSKKWVHIAQVFTTNGQITGYLNGVQVAQTPTGYWTGARAANSLMSFLATYSVDETRGMADFQYATATAWTATDVANNFWCGTALPGVTHRWPFNDLTGTTALDTVGGVNAVLASGAQFTPDSPMKRRIPSLGPGSFPDCNLWCRADQGVSIRDGLVEQIADQSNAGNHLGQATPANQGQLLQNGLTGRPALYFTQDAGSMATPSPWWSSAAVRTLAFVYSVASSGNISLGGSGAYYAGGAFDILSGYGGSFPRVYTVNNPVTWSAVTAYATGMHCCICVYDGSTIYIYLDGVLASQSTQALGTYSGAFNVGTRTGWSANGLKIGMVGSWTRAFSLQEVQTFNGWAQSIWGAG